MRITNTFPNDLLNEFPVDNQSRMNKPMKTDTSVTAVYPRGSTLNRKTGTVM